MVAKSKTYLFGDFKFVPSESLLLKHETPIALPHKALNVLEKLVENAGSIVTKNELIRDVWDDLAIEESAVPRTVFLVRTALGDDPRNHMFIQTVPKRGYRFVAEVSTVNGSWGQVVSAEHVADASPVSVGDVQPISAAGPQRFSAVRLAAVALLLASAATGTYLGFFRDVPVVSEKASLLVMPVTSAQSQDQDELLENGIADALIHLLAYSKEIAVRPLSATRSYSGKTVDPIQAGREQKVGKVLSASYQRADGNLRILARLINVETAETEESYKYETSETGLFAIQDEIAAYLGNKIALTLGGTIAPAKSHGTTNEEAYRHYLQGIALYDRRNGPNAVESFDRAIDLDPNYARAWVGKAVALGAMSSLGDSTSAELYEKTVQAAERALTLDAVSADAYSALCGARLTYAHDFAGAGQACTKALELDPNSAIVLQSYSFFLVSQGRFDESIQAIKTALDIEPTSLFSHRLYANTLYLARRYDEAYAQYARLIELQPDRLPTYEWMIRTLEASKREPEAMEWLVKSLKVQNADDALVRRIRHAYQNSGWPGVLRERIGMDKNIINHFRRAGLNARLGEKDAAFEHLEKAYKQRLPVFVTLRVEPQFDPLRDDPRYSELVKRMESGSR
jgi:DNA-binding winged helix-turn-helix (wHTH) protein/TolB-like protein/Tfp pilus assembly protein PilF